MGRGTDAPFEQIGADWIHGAGTGAVPEHAHHPGRACVSDALAAFVRPFAGKTIEGVHFVILNREQFDSVHLGIELAYALQKLYPGKINFEACRFLIGNREGIEALKAAGIPDASKTSRRVTREL